MMDCNYRILNSSFKIITDWRKTLDKEHNVIKLDKKKFEFDWLVDIYLFKDKDFRISQL